ncbi:protein of unknown function [Nitrospira defluvii]|uniref:Uncharacterized protein n=1 Tax=Nitrospira defluvii TaxID=330214 RepID=D8PFQ9_9BACT|nr:protein of unknown function [Nitrospira defluvii]
MRHGEPLSDARTPLADFFRILLVAFLLFSGIPDTCLSRRWLFYPLRSFKYPSQKLLLC